MEHPEQARVALPKINLWRGRGGGRMPRRSRRRTGDAAAAISLAESLGGRPRGNAGRVARADPDYPSSDPACPTALLPFLPLIGHTGTRECALLLRLSTGIKRCRCRTM